jgi:hypothetical protein
MGFRKKMYQGLLIFTALLMNFIITLQTRAQPDFHSAEVKNADALTISITNLDINDKTLNLSYEIRNTTNQDIWVLVGFGFPQNDTTFEVLMDMDDQTLLMQTRLDFPMIYITIHNLHGRYVLLRPGQIRTESVTLPIPVHPSCPFGGGGRKQVVEQAKRLAIKIGYYSGDLPKMIWEVIEKPETIGNISKINHHKLINNYFTEPLPFNWVNEILKERDEEILVPHTDQYLEYEKILQTVVEDLIIPYDEKYDLDTKPESPDIPPCTRIVIEFRPSMLEYYFPYVGQQNLLSDSERQTLRSSRYMIMDNQEQADNFVNDINEMIIFGGVVRQTSLAHVVCYRETKPLTSFDIFNDNCVVTDACDRYIHTKGLWSLRKFTPQIEPFELRVQCAANLRNLWHRLRLNYKARKTFTLTRADSFGKTEMSYPAPTNWCDVLVRACRTIKKPHQYIIKMRNQEIIGPHICPGTGEDKKHLAKSHYAMNPNCKMDSPTDMVLLFETKTGWNQHGGPELFTFDNHDPKGGCVLLNDGTVKFIRAMEELKQLQWK